MGREKRTEQAARALETVRAQQHKALSAQVIPTWYWAAIGALCVLFTAGLETGTPLITALASAAFTLGIAVTVAAVVVRAKVQIRNDLLGVRGGLVIVGFVLALVAVSLAVALALAAAGVAYPGTLATLVTFAGLVVGGPLLTRHLRGVMAANADRSLRSS